MLILITALLLFATALTLLVLRLVRPQFRFSWLIAVGVTFLAWITVILWRLSLPLSISFGTWGSADILPTAPTLAADQFSWIYAFSLTTLALATLLTATVRQGFPDAGELSVSLAICGLGVLAVTAGNPLTLALIWAALDLAELITMLSATGARGASGRVVAAFSMHAAAIILLMLAQIASGSPDKPAGDFASIAPQAGLLLLAAAGLRLGVLPLHLPYVLGSGLRRGIGTNLRLSSAAAGLILLTRVPAASLSSWVTILILVVAGAAGLYASWMWLRAPDELAGRPFWIIGLASLAVYSALRGNPVGSAAWGSGLILAGAALFLFSAQHIWLNRLLFTGAWVISALPFSLTATGWDGSGGVLLVGLPAFLIAQAMLMAGFVRHVIRPSARTSLQSQPAWTRSVYPAGIVLLILVAVALGLWGWDGALALGAVLPGLIAALLTLALLWAVPRFRILNPIPAHWLRPSTGARLSRLTGGFAGAYRWLAGISQMLSDVLEGEAGLMWTLLFLVLLIVLIVKRNP
ncbi:MAG TPA: hypothetical protein VMJ64_03835 [Anaerolineales bacterium]|nr:hypothetical protein [Anaerolineales bacterium]